jgi:plasmid stabilization system protein ParE
VRIRCLDQAVAVLVTARNHIAKDNPSAAREAAQSIRQAVAILTDYPAAGRPGRVPNTR